MSAEKAKELGLKPLFTILDYAEVSQPTKDIATVPGLSIKKVLEQNDLTVKDLELIEINEAFAAVAIISARTILGMSKEEMFKKVNVNGSAIAYGHPIGATGARILMTLGYELRRRGGGTRGLRHLLGPRPGRCDAHQGGEIGTRLGERGPSTDNFHPIVHRFADASILRASCICKSFDKE